MRRVVGRKDRRLVWVVLVVAVIAVVGIIGYGVVSWNEGVSGSDRGVAGTDKVSLLGGKFVADWRGLEQCVRRVQQDFVAFADGVLGG